ncbi:GDP-fucose transporter nac isoform X2 [Megachile rotundata]|uniref:GDP-fucose transporter nac isoform X2 n=1 Tax=Megachile rotundata TaxID=143995 RepID=UPI000614E9EA|nr:PREDICTED: GDP-fucose transporter 1 isoform X2 [Megachile rotundata]
MSLEIGILPKFIHITIVVVAYWIISILTVFINKALLSSNSINLDAPLFVTWCQCIVSLIICASLSKLSKEFPEYIKFPDGNPYTKETLSKILPLSLLFTGMIATNNLCLKYVGIAFYYVGRSLTTVFNVIFTYLILGQRTSIKCIACCTFIVTGFWLGVDQEHIAVYNYDKIGSLFFWSAMIVGGICGFAIGYVTALQIKVTSPLTHNISGTAKACAQTVLATYWFNEEKSFMWWMSNFIVLGASAMYARFRQLDLSKEYREEKQLLKV